MRRLVVLWTAAALASPAFAQQQQPGTPSPQAGEEGFFRPAPDIAINRPPPAVTPRGAVVQPFVTAPDPLRALPPEGSMDTPPVVSLAPPEAVDRELERSRREHERAREETARRPPPAIVSTLDGNAPIVSPLDGTAPIISPLGR